MPYVDSGDIRIYYEVEGSGPPLVLQHGLTSTLEDWREDGYAEYFKSDYRLVLVDARGHGKSDKPHDIDSYRVSKRAMDVVAVLDALGIERAHFWGVSMGAAIGYGLLWKAPERIDALVLGAGQPYQMPASSPVPALVAQGAEAVIEFLERARPAGAPPMSDAKRRRFLANDMEAIAAAAQFPWESEPIVSAIKGFDRPFLLYGGDFDWGYEHMKRVKYDSPRVEFVTLEGVDHPGSWNRKDLVLPMVKNFLGRQN